MAFLDSLSISGSALTAQKFRMDIISQNIANADTTRTEEGGAYRRKMVVFTPKENGFGEALSSASQQFTGGVHVTEVVEDQSALTPVYNPTHPDADAQGYVMMPNVDTVKEMTDMISATRSYQANITAFNAVKQMAQKALDIGK